MTPSLFKSPIIISGKTAAIIFFITSVLVGLAYLFQFGDGEGYAAATAAKANNNGNRQELENSLRRVPLYFEPNVGQQTGIYADEADSSTHPSFFTWGNGYEMALSADRASMSFAPKGCAGQNDDKAQSCESKDKAVSTLTVKMVGANLQARISGEEKADGKINYLTGDAPEKWLTDIPTFKKVRSRGIYEGIDMVYYGRQTELEFDFIVAPHADPQQIKMDFSGADQLAKDVSGGLVVSLPHGEVVLRKPVLYQSDANGSRREVEGSFNVSRDNQVGFEIGDYDRSRELVIDPILNYSTFLPGASIGYDIAVDNEGNAYVTGNAPGGGFPTTVGTSGGGVFVTKFNPQGSNLVFSTRVGGSGASSLEIGRAIKLDAQGNVVVAGSTSSRDFPHVNPVKRKSTFYMSDNGGNSWTNSTNLEDYQVFSIAPSQQNANLLYAAASSQIYKSANGGTSWTNTTNNLPPNSSIQTVAVNPGNDLQVYAAPAQNGLYRSNDGGNTWSQVTGAVPQSFGVSAIQFAPGNPQSIYLATNGGIRKTSDGGANWASSNTGLPASPNITALAVDPQNPQILYAGTATQGVYKSTDAGANWAAINTGFGGNNSNIIRKLAIDPNNPAIVYAATGNYVGANYVFKTVNGGGNWALTYTSPAATSNEIGSIAVSRTDSAKLYVGLLRGGFFRSTNGGASWSRAQNGMWSSSIATIVESPLTANKLFVGAGQDSTSDEAFVFKLNPSGSSLIFSTTLGGSEYEIGYALAVDQQGNAYVGGVTKSFNFPTVNAFQNAHTSEAAEYVWEEGFVAKVAATGNTLGYSTYLGGNSYDIVSALAVDSGNNLIVTGQTQSPNFPVWNALQPSNNNSDAFLTKLSPDGGSLVFSTFFGGSGGDGANGVDVDENGNIIMTGTTTSNNFPISNALQPSPGGEGDGFVSKFSPNGGQVLFSTYFGGAQSDRIQDVDVNADGSIYFAGTTASQDFPQTRSVKSRSPYFRTADNGARWSNFNTNNYYGIYDYAFHPNDPAIIFGVSNKGVVKTIDGGDTWNLLPNPPAAQSYNSIEIDPQNPNTIYLGFRDPNSANVGKLAVSTNGGQTWAVNNQLSVGSSAIFRIYVSPVNSQLIYAVTDFAAYKTIDGGATWTRLTTIALTFIQDFAVNPSNSSILYIAQANSGGGIHRSIDGGATWSRMSNGISGAYAVFVEINPQQPATVYARTQDGVFKTTNNGDSWAAMTVPQIAGTFTADPFSATTLYMAGALDNNSVPGIFRSTDGGASWQFFNQGFSGRGSCGLIEPDTRLTGVLHAQCGVGGEDIFVSRLSPDGANLIYSTAFGGDVTSGSSFQDTAFAIAASPGGSAFVTGATSSSDFPTTPGAYHRTISNTSLFVARFDSSWKVNGRITDAQSGNSIANVDLTLAGASTMTTATEGLGKYSFPNVAANSSFVLTPRKLGYDFTPANYSVSSLQQDRELNFTGTYVTHTIQGRVTFNQNPLPNVTVYLTGSKSETALTNASGEFSFTVPKHGDYIVRPELYGYVFTPAQKTYTGLASNVQSDFAARSGYRISGQARRNGNPLAGVSITLSGSENQTVVTNTEGRYSFDAGAGGNYLISAAASGFAFQPENHYFGNLSAAQDGGNFDAVLLANRIDSITFVSEPSFSESQTELFGVDPDTGAIRRLTQTAWGEGQPAWSKNGRQIAYISSQTGNPLLSVMDYEAKNSRTLVTNLSASSPDWSPDGTKIVFQAYEPNFGTEIYVVNSDGSNLQRLTTDSSDSYNPSWSSDGMKIAFARNSKIQLMNPDGTGIQRLTSSNLSEDEPAWSPDGTQLVLVGNGRLYLVGRDGSNLRRLTAEEAQETSPSWSPDGIRVAYLREGSFGNVYSINADGSDRKQITNTTLRKYTPVYKPRLKRAAAADFDGDGKSDPAVFRPNDRSWYMLRSRSGFTGTQFGIATDKPISADYDGDGLADIAVFRPESESWYIVHSRTGLFTAVNFGVNTDIPTPADFDGDLKADVAVFRPENGYWYITRSSDQAFQAAQFGANGDVPMPADFDGDAKDDLAIFRPSNGTWYIMQSVNNHFRPLQFGSNGDKPIAGDFDGDGKSDIAVYRPSDGSWYRLNSSDNSFVGTQFGISSDIPASGDYDGNGRTDHTVFRDGVWYILFSGAGNYTGIQFGQTGDIPINAARSALPQ